MFIFTLVAPDMWVRFYRGKASEYKFDRCSSKKQKYVKIVRGIWPKDKLCYMFEKINHDVQHKDNNDVQEVWVPQICGNTLQKCNKNNDFACSAQGRLQNGMDLVAEEVVYHRTCYEKFLSNEGESNPVRRP